MRLARRFILFEFRSTGRNVRKIEIYFLALGYEFTNPLRRSPKAFRRPNLSSVQRRLSVINRVYSKQASVRTKAHSAYPPPRRRLCRMPSNQHLVRRSGKFRPPQSARRETRGIDGRVCRRRWDRDELLRPCRTQDFRARNAGTSRHSAPARPPIIMLRDMTESSKPSLIATITRTRMQPGRKRSRTILPLMILPFPTNPWEPGIAPATSSR